MKKALKSTLATLALGLALGAAMPAMAQSNTGNFDVTLTVTAPQQPTVEISEIDNLPLLTVSSAQLLNDEATDQRGYFCVAVTNPDNASIAPKVRFSQPGVTFRPEIGTDFALVGNQNRLDGTQAQLPLRLRFGGGGDSAPVSAAMPNVDVQRDEIIGQPVAYASNCLGGPTQYGSGFATTTKPVVSARRLAAADGNNPAGNYSATILVTVLPN